MTELKIGRERLLIYNSSVANYKIRQHRNMLPFSLLLSLLISAKKFAWLKEAFCAKPDFDEVQLKGTLQTKASERYVKFNK